MDKYRPIELAFQEIRAKTGNTDVRLLVEKFMNKEQTYASLLQAVKANEQKYEELRKINIEKMRKVNDLKIANDNRKTISVPDQENEKEKEKFEKQIQGLEATQDLTMEKQEHEYALGLRVVQMLEIEEESINQRKKNIMLVNNQVNGWMGRVASKLAELSEDYEGAQKIQRNSMVEQYKYIAGKVSGLLSQIKLEKANAQKDDESINGYDFMHDFAKEDYVTKNIRVMPMAGGTLDNQSEHTSKHHHGSPNREESDVEDAKVNYEIYHELMDARSIVKEKKLEEERKAKELAEKLAKKNKK